MVECACAMCKTACTHKPGWFLPSDIPKLAKHLGISEQELVRTRLAVDYYVPSTQGATLDQEGRPQFREPPIFILTPCNTKTSPGEVYGLDPRGRCIFFTDDQRCAIHAAKPHECRQYFHNDRERRIHERKAGIVRVWRRHQQWLFDLLGYVPKVPVWTPGDMTAVALDNIEKYLR